MSLQQQQQAFTAWIRDPENSPNIDDVAGERMDLYRELFFNNILDTLSNAFPVLHQVLDESQWLQLCQNFFARHQCHTPYLSHVPGEFVQFLEARSEPAQPWLLELAQWEWSELELFLAEDETLPEKLDNDPLHGIPVLTSLLRLHECRYPVHQISDDFIPDAPAEQLQYLLAWRKRDDSVGFMQINALSAVIIRIMQDNRQQPKPCTGLELLSTIAHQQNEFEPSMIISGGTELLQTMASNKIILGSLSAPSKEPPHE